MAVNIGIYYFDQENLGDPQLYYYNELGQVVDCADGGDRRGGFIIDYDEGGYITHVYSYGRSGATGAFPKANYLTNPKLTFIWE